MRHLRALLLATNSLLRLVYVPTEHNPADAPSHPFLTAALERQSPGGWVYMAVSKELLMQCSWGWSVFGRSQDFIAAARSLEEILPRINGFSSEPAPDHLLLNSEVSVHQLQSGRDSVSWIAAM
ncbi:unnamed protein product [Durusdinium trenchii]|uniref:Uncharacterized protein n=1 Tax=Durusdinium trenchii TaxID=1381693 RepID=A0ABP0PE02_9DINO